MTRARIAIAATDETAGAFQSVRQRLGDLSTRAESVSARFSGLGASVLGLVGGASALGAFITSTTQAVARLQDLKDASGGSIESLSQLVSVAQRAGVDFSTVQQSLLKFNQTLNTAQAGGPAVQLIERLGLSVAALRKQDPAEALVAVAQGLGRFAEDGDRARAQALLFGEGVGRIAPLLKELNSGLSAGALVTTKQAQAYDELAKSASKLGADLQELAVRAAGPAVTGIARLFALSDKAKSAGFGGIFDAALAFNTTELDRLGNLNERLTVLATRYREVSTLAEGIRASGKLVPQELASELASLERRERFLRMLQKDRGGGRGDGPGAAPAESIGSFDNVSAIKASKSALDSFVQSLRDQLLATQNVSAEEQARISINRGLLGVLAEGDQAQVLALARGLDVARLRKQADEESNALKAEGARLTASLRTEEEQQADYLARAAFLLDKGAIGWEAYGRVATQGLAKITQQINSIDLPKIAQLAPVLDTATESILSLGRQAGRSIEDAFGSSLLAAFQGNTRNILQIWGDMIQRMTAQALAARLTTALFGNLVSTGQLGGLVGGALSFGGARANGGPVYAGRAYLVGERGPELIVPQSAGTVVPNSAMGGVTVHQHYNVAAGVTRGELVAALQLARQQSRADLMAELRARRVV